MVIERNCTINYLIHCSKNTCQKSTNKTKANLSGCIVFERSIIESVATNEGSISQQSAIRHFWN